jgi:hypothetical protein
MNKKKFKIILIAFAFSFILIVPISYSVGANSQQTVAAAGSREDPLVTASYVAKYVNEALEAQNLTSYEVVTLTKNQRIRAKSGTLELILRPGSEARITAQAGTGIADITAGRELVGGDAVSVNHLLVIPRADKRGLVILSNTAYILVRGDYEIE